MRVAEGQGQAVYLPEGAAVRGRTEDDPLDVVGQRPQVDLEGVADRGARGRLPGVPHGAGRVHRLVVEDEVVVGATFPDAWSRRALVSTSGVCALTVHRMETRTVAASTRAFAPLLSSTTDGMRRCCRRGPRRSARRPGLLLRRRC